MPEHRYANDQIDDGSFIRLPGSKGLLANLAIGGFVIFVIWMTLGAYQSHYISALRVLGDTTTSSIIGVPKEGRGDEWSTYLPMLKQAYHEGFSTFSKLEPYRERMDWFISIPHMNFSLVFLPNQLTYWIFPGAKALSFQGFYYNALFIGSMIWFLVNVGVKKRLAIAAAVVLLFSQFYQMWWTSNFPALGASLLPFAVLTSSFRYRYKFPLLFWSLGHMLFGEMYPPFYIALAAALLPFTLAARPDLITLKQLSLSALASVAALGAYLLLNWDFVQLVSGTTYPGHRINLGGDSSIRAIASLIFPTFPLEASRDTGGALYEFSMAGTLLPLLLLAICPWIKWDKSTLRVTIVFLLTVAALVYYMLFGFSEPIAKLTGFFLVPAHRMHLGLSVLVASYSILMISRNWSQIRVMPLVIVMLCYAIASHYVGVSSELAENFFGIEYYAYIPLLLILLVVPYALLPSRRSNIAPVLAAFLLIGMAATHLIVYGSFNPIMRASDILKPVDTQITRDWKALYQKNGMRPLAVIGNYGHVLRGEGFPALEAIHLANVNPLIYKALFPNLSLKDIDTLFNQFRGIAFANIAKMDASGATVVFPVKPYAVPFAHRIVRDAAGRDPLSIGDISASVVRSDAGEFVVNWESSLAKPLPIGAPLTLLLACSAKDSWLTRYPVAIAGQPLVKAALQGLAGEMTILSDTKEHALDCVSKMQISSKAGPAARKDAASELQSAKPSARKGVESIVPGEDNAGGATANHTVHEIESGKFKAGVISQSTAIICSFDSVDGNYSKDRVKLMAGRSHVFRGWILDEAKKPIDKFRFVFEGSRSFAVDSTTGAPRPDVAAYFNDQANLKAGFEFSSNLDHVPAGEYHVYLISQKNMPSSSCDTGKTLTVE